MSTQRSTYCSFGRVLASEQVWPKQREREREIQRGRVGLFLERDNKKQQGIVGHYLEAKVH